MGCVDRFFCVGEVAGTTLFTAGVTLKFPNEEQRREKPVAASGLCILGSDFGAF